MDGTLEDDADARRPSGATMEQNAVSPNNAPTYMSIRPKMVMVVLTLLLSVAWVSFSTISNEAWLETMKLEFGTSSMNWRGINRTDSIHFDPNASAVIVTKIHNSATVKELNQALCLLTHAYNNRVKYDIVVFTAEPLLEQEISQLQRTVAPAKLTVVRDNPGLQEIVDELPGKSKKVLLNRCNVSKSSDLSWPMACVENTTDRVFRDPLQYAWQAEFRSLHLWTQPVLEEYRYMMWMDSDAFCTRVWKEDPIATMIQNDLVLLFDHFPGGRSKGKEWTPRIQEAFGRKLCKVEMKKGRLVGSARGCSGENVNIQQVHGFFHVTDLDFFRSETVMNWFQIMIGDNKFSRMFDDQAAITIPSAILAGERSWDMRSHGLKLNVTHNFYMDARGKERTGGFRKFWPREGPSRFPEAYGKCVVTEPGR